MAILNSAVLLGEVDDGDDYVEGHHSEMLGVDGSEIFIDGNFGANRAFGAAEWGSGHVHASNS